MTTAYIECIVSSSLCNFANELCVSLFLTRPDGISLSSSSLYVNRIRCSFNVRALICAENDEYNLLVTMFNGFVCRALFSIILLNYSLSFDPMSIWLHLTHWATHSWACACMRVPEIIFTSHTDAHTHTNAYPLMQYRKRKSIEVVDIFWGQLWSFLICPKTIQSFV